MNDKPFVLNNRFWVYPQLGLIKQKDPVKETRLEPRLMNLLCVLAARQGELVSRELLTKEVWDDYGNADEGLTQGISYLRKVLNDEARTLIETVPKKGYVLHAVVEAETGIGKAANQGASKTRRTYWAAAAFLLIVIATAYFLINHFNHPTHAADVINGNRQADSTTNKNPDVVKKQAPGNSDALPDTNKNANQNPDLKK